LLALEHHAKTSERALSKAAYSFIDQIRGVR